MSFPQGRFATVISSLLGVLDNRCTIYGTGGRIEIEDITCPKKIRIFGPDGEQKQEINLPEKQISGYEYEFIAARQAVIVGRMETPENTRTNMLTLYNFTDTLRKTWDIIYPLPGEDATAARDPQVKRV